MNFRIEEKPSDSPLVERIWRAQGDRTGTFISQAKANSEIVLTRYRGKTTLTVRGPETKATFLDYQSVGAEFLGITFKLGTFMPPLLPKDLRDWRNVDLPEASSKSFWLQGSAWQFPNYENVDTFIARLVHEGLLVSDPVVDAVLQGHSSALSVRSVQYHFLHATGLTNRTIQRITQARQAYALLEQGASIFDTISATGFADQPHLTRSLKHFFGQTPGQKANFNLLT
ncbi:MAG: AraC family transcriptional regulator [Anaerolineae bacterium]|nr:AraC family transcriptional regulator [Anaerolineae bacterium]